MDSYIDTSKSGSQNTKTFMKLANKVMRPILKNLDDKNTPVLWILDGHVTHKTIQIKRWCEKHKVILVLLFPNTTHASQPLDMVFFRPFNVKFKKLLREISDISLSGLIEKINETINSMCTSPGKLKDKYSKMFEPSGWFPFNPQKDRSQFLTPGYSSQPNPLSADSNSTHKLIGNSTSSSNFVQNKQHFLDWLTKLEDSPLMEKNLKLISNIRVNLNSLNPPDERLQFPKFENIAKKATKRKQVHGVINNIDNFPIKVEDDSSDAETTVAGETSTSRSDSIKKQKVVKDDRIDAELEDTYISVYKTSPGELRILFCCLHLKYFFWFFFCRRLA